MPDNIIIITFTLNFSIILINNEIVCKSAISLFLFTWIAGGAAAQNNIIDEIVWVVGDEAILKSEVEEYRKDIQMQNQRIEGDPYCFIPEQLAINKLFSTRQK